MNDTLLQSLNWRDPSDLPMHHYKNRHFESDVDLQPGMVLVDMEEEVWLVGNISALGGTCDHCPSGLTEKPKERLLRWAWLPGFEPVEEKAAAPDVPIRWLDD